MIIPYLRDLTNDHKPTMELTNKANNSDTEREESIIQLIIQNNCVSSKDFEEIRSIYSASNNIEIFMGSDTDDVIDKLFDTIFTKVQRSNRNIKSKRKRIYS